MRKTKKVVKSVSTENIKVCWLSVQNKNGWSLGLCIGNKKTLWLTGLRLATEKDVNKLLSRKKVSAVFIHLKNDKKNIIKGKRK